MLSKDKDYTLLSETEIINGLNDTKEFKLDAKTLFDLYQPVNNIKYFTELLFYLQSLGLQEH